MLALLKRMLVNHNAKKEWLQYFRLVLQALIQLKENLKFRLSFSQLTAGMDGLLN